MVANIEPQKTLYPHIQNVLLARPDSCTPPLYAKERRSQTSTDLTLTTARGKDLRAQGQVEAKPCNGGVTLEVLRFSAHHTKSQQKTVTYGNACPRQAHIIDQSRAHNNKHHPLPVSIDESSMPISSSAGHSSTTTAAKANRTHAPVTHQGFIRHN